MNKIDNFLNRITMYRLVLNYLIILLMVAVIYSVFDLLPYSPIALIVSILVLIWFSLLTEKVYSKVYNAQTNTESVYITALILVFLISPAQSINDIFFLMWVGILAEASKYILAINKKHIFNPAAIAIVLTSVAANQSASWWIGNMYMMPFVVIGGLLIVSLGYPLIFILGGILILGVGILGKKFAKI